MLHRHLTDALQAAAATSPVATLSGPRESGKTTVARALFADHRYRSHEAPDQRLRALAGPRSVLAQGDHPANLEMTGVERRVASCHPLFPRRDVGGAVR